MSFAFTASNAAIKIQRGRTLEGSQLLALAALDQAVCLPSGIAAASVPPHLKPHAVAICGAWAGGRAVGELINVAPMAFGFERSVQDAWTDLLVEWNHPDPTPEDLRRLEALYRDRLKKAKQAQYVARGQAARCEAPKQAAARKDLAAPVASAEAPPDPTARKAPMTPAAGSSDCAVLRNNKASMDLQSRDPAAWLALNGRCGR